MYKFCDILVREFKYMNKLQEDKILFEVGYRDTLAAPLPHAGEGKLFDEIMSVQDQPEFSFLGDEDRLEAMRKPRANSIHTFIPPKIRVANPDKKRKPKPE